MNIASQPLPLGNVMKFLWEGERRVREGLYVSLKRGREGKREQGGWG